MSMKTRVSAYTLSVALVCSSGAFAQQKAEVLHWWTSAGESASVKVFADQFTKAGGTWVDNAIAGGANARTAGINRMVGGNPPTMMQFNTGKQFDELVSNDLLRDVEAQAKAGKWREIMPKPIVDATVRERQVLCGSGQYPRPELDVLQHQDLRRCRPSSRRRPSPN